MWTHLAVFVVLGLFGQSLAQTVVVYSRSAQDDVLGSPPSDDGILTFVGPGGVGTNTGVTTILASDQWSDFSAYSTDFSGRPLNNPNGWMFNQSVWWPFSQDVGTTLKFDFSGQSLPTHDELILQVFGMAHSGLENTPGSVTIDGNLAMNFQVHHTLSFAPHQGNPFEVTDAVQYDSGPGQSSAPVLSRFNFALQVESNSPNPVIEMDMGVTDPSSQESWGIFFVVVYTHRSIEQCVLPDILLCNGTVFETGDTNKVLEDTITPCPSPDCVCVSSLCSTLPPPEPTTTTPTPSGDLAACCIRRENKHGVCENVESEAACDAIGGHGWEGLTVGTCETEYNRHRCAQLSSQHNPLHSRHIGLWVPPHAHYHQGRKANEKHSS